MKKSQISVSIDDGHPLDLKAAEILGKKNIHTTFYIPIKNSTGRPTLNRKQIKWLSEQPNFEIGGHTYNHIDLTKVPLNVAEEEMRSGKEALEDIIGKPVTTFAWPWGRYNSNLVKRARGIGFHNCRSAATLNLNVYGGKSFLWHPNLHIYPHMRLRGMISGLIRGDVYTFVTRLKRIRHTYLEELEVLNLVGKPTHVWFHSWEIEELNMWSSIENL